MAGLFRLVALIALIAFRADRASGALRTSRTGRANRASRADGAGQTLRTGRTLRTGQTLWARRTNRTGRTRRASRTLRASRTCRALRAAAADHDLAAFLADLQIANAAWRKNLYLQREETARIRLPNLLAIQKNGGATGAGAPFDAKIALADGGFGDRDFSLRD